MPLGLRPILSGPLDGGSDTDATLDASAAVISFVSAATLHTSILLANSSAIAFSQSTSLKTGIPLASSPQIAFAQSAGLFTLQSIAALPGIITFQQISATLINNTTLLGLPQIFFTTSADISINPALRATNVTINFVGILILTTKINLDGGATLTWFANSPDIVTQITMNANALVSFASTQATLVGQAFLRSVGLIIFFATAKLTGQTFLVATVGSPINISAGSADLTTDIRLVHSATISINSTGIIPTGAMLKSALTIIQFINFPTPKLSTTTKGSVSPPQADHMKATAQYTIKAAGVPHYYTSIKIKQV